MRTNDGYNTNKLCTLTNIHTCIHPSIHPSIIYIYTCLNECIHARICVSVYVLCVYRSSPSLLLYIFPILSIKIFESNETDCNVLSAVDGKCEVLDWALRQERGDEEDVFFCRYVYNPRSCSFIPRADAQ